MAEQRFTLRRMLLATLHSRTTRMLAASVFFSLLLSQLAFGLPGLWRSYEQSVTEFAAGERGRLQSRLLAADADSAPDAATWLSSAIRGLRFRDADGQIELELGSTVSSGVTPIGWTLELPSGTRVVDAFLDTRDARLASLIEALRGVLFALGSSLFATLLTVGFVARYHVLPLDAFGRSLDELWSDSDGSVPEPLEVPDAEELEPLVAAFNTMLAAQRKALRQVKVKQQYLEFAAHHDPLTHLPNRLMFEDALKCTTDEARRCEARFAVFLIDLDRFKFINDQYGNLVGDRIVAEVAHRLRRMTRNNDLVARLDGDEFALIQRDVADREAAAELASRIMKVLQVPFDYRGFRLKLSASIGVSCFPADAPDEPGGELVGEELVNNAGVALQKAKSEGRGRYRLFDDSMRHDIGQRVRLEQALRVALAENQFEVYYQPKIDLATRRVAGSEALLRWRHPEDGFVSPVEFVPVAEEAGLIIDIGYWVLRTACDQTCALHAQGYAGLGVAVNISAVQFTDGKLLAMVDEALQKSQLPPGLLELEITESTVMHDPEEVVESLHQLHRLGVRLAIDDFGTGYSSLAYLKRFPVDTLKIDRAFIVDISSDGDDVAIVESILGLGRHFGMKVVAEGVEEEEQLHFLKRQGCDIAQGYVVGRPMPFEDYVAWLERWPYGIADHRNPLALPLAANH